MRRTIAKLWLRSYKRAWNHHARSFDSARSSISGTGVTEKEFDAEGMQIANMLRKHIDSDSSVLELGCGAGRVMKHLALFCREVHGVDVSPHMIGLAKLWLKDVPNTTLHVNNGRDLSGMRPNNYDFAFSLYVFRLWDKTLRTHPIH